MGCQRPYICGGPQSIDKHRYDPWCSSEPGPVHATGPGFGILSTWSSLMDITSPFFVVPLIVAVFTVCILWGTSTKEDGAEHNGHAH